MIVITSELQFTLNWATWMGHMSILFVLSGIELHCCLVVSVVRVVVLRRGVFGLRLVLHASATPSSVLRGLLSLPCVCCVLLVVASIA